MSTPPQSTSSPHLSSHLYVHATSVYFLSPHLQSPLCPRHLSLLPLATSPVTSMSTPPQSTSSPHISSHLYVHATSVYFLSPHLQSPLCPRHLSLLPLPTSPVTSMSTPPQSTSSPHMSSHLYVHATSVYFLSPHLQSPLCPRHLSLLPLPTSPVTSMSTPPQSTSSPHISSHLYVHAPQSTSSPHISSHLYVHATSVYFLSPHLQSPLCPRHLGLLPLATSPVTSMSTSPRSTSSPHISSHLYVHVTSVYFLSPHLHIEVTGDVGRGSRPR